MSSNVFWFTIRSMIFATLATLVMSSLWNESQQRHLECALSAAKFQKRYINAVHISWIPAGAHLCLDQHHLLLALVLLLLGGGRFQLLLIPLLLLQLLDVGVVDLPLPEVVQVTGQRTPPYVRHYCLHSSVHRFVHFPSLIRKDWSARRIHLCCQLCVCACGNDVRVQSEQDWSSFHCC